MDALAEELRRSLDERSDALAERLAALRGTLVGDDDALGAALDLFAFFPQALSDVVEKEWVRNSAAVSRVQILRPLLRHLTDVGIFVEDWLSNTGAVAVPLYVLDSVKRTCADLGLGDRGAVISAGPADNYMTMTASIEEVVFKRLGSSCPSIPTALTNPKLILMRAPRREGGLARWHPVLLGHELAHLGVVDYDALTALDLQKSFDWSAASALAVPNATLGVSGAMKLWEISQNWATELLCDAYAIRRFGAGAVASLGEFLEVIAATDHLSSTHPPGRLRNKLLIDWLGPASDNRIGAVLGPWQQLASGPLKFSQPWVQFLADLLLSRSVDIKNVVDAWPGSSYDTVGRSKVASKVADDLESGMPPDSTIEVDGENLDVGDADVVLAAWIGKVERFSTPVDALAGKSLDSQEFVRRWKNAGGGLPSLQATATKHADEQSALSAEDITARVNSQDDFRLVVRPLLPDFASGSGLDLRLGNTFIVFSRSRITSFHPLGETTDPRQMQRSMQLAWGETFVLHPSELVLASTLEYLVLPGDLSAQVLSRSSYGRLGLLSATAVQVHPHFHGCLTLELVNLGTVPLVLTPGERVAQLVLFPTSSLPAPPPTKYHCPVGPEFSKVRTDEEAGVLRRLR